MTDAGASAIAEGTLRGGGTPPSRAPSKALRSPWTVVIVAAALLLALFPVLSDDLYYYFQYVKFGFGRTVRDASRFIQNGHLTREEGLDLGAVARLDLAPALDLGVELGAQQHHQVRDPQPDEEDDHAG